MLRRLGKVAVATGLILSTPAALAETPAGTAPGSPAVQEQIAPSPEAAQQDVVAGTFQLHCKDVDATVQAPAEESVDMICNGTQAAVSIFRGCGIDQRGRIEIKVRDDASEPARENYGCYDHSTGQIHLMSLSGCRKHLAEDKSRSEIDAEDYYKSVIIHEVAHKILLSQVGSDRISRVAHEYLAYSLQIEALSAKSRKLLIDKFAGPGSMLPGSPNAMLLFMNPTVFGVVSYLHFKALADRCGTIQKVLDGSIDFPEPYE